MISKEIQMHYLGILCYSESSFTRSFGEAEAGQTRSDDVETRAFPIWSQLRQEGNDLLGF
jgi:hypothetical protein